MPRGCWFVVPGRHVAHCLGTHGPSRSPRGTVDWDTFCHWALAGKGEGNGSGVMLLFVVRLLAPNRMR